MSRKQKKKDAREQSTRQLMGIDDITDYGIATRMGELVFFAIKPTNISVLCPAQCGQGHGGDRDAGVKFQGVL